jgi:hypothetical protein
MCYAGLRLRSEISKTRGMEMDARVPPTDHSLPQLSICALVALLCHLFSTHCLAADVAFSSDNQRIYAVSSTDEGRTALREINLATNTARVIPLVELDDPKIYASSFTFDIACCDEAKILLVSKESLWAFDPQSGRPSKLCGAPSRSWFGGIADDPKGHAVYVWADNNALFMVKNGRELVPVKVQGQDQIANLVCSWDGQLFYRQDGDLWSGEIKSDGDSLWVEAERYASGQQLSRAAELDAYPVVNLAVARDGIYVQVWQYHNRGRGFGALLKLPPPARNAEADIQTRDLAVKKPGQHQEALNSVKSVGETKIPILLGASPDGSRVYYNTGEGEYLVTNGRTEKLQLREADQNADTHRSTSVSANSAEAKAEPSSSATIPSDVVAAVAEREIDAISSQNIDALISSYADEVDLLDKGMVSKDTARQDLQQYFDRWPVTKWKLSGKIEVKPLTASRYQVTFPVTFEVANPATNRRIVGTANETRTVVIDSAGTAKIVSQHEKIIRSHR